MVWTLPLAASLLIPTRAAAQTVAPPKDAGYVLPDGTVRMVGAASMEGVITRLDELFVKTHPGVRFRYEKADNNGAIDALIFDATPLAPVGTVYGGGIAYSDIVKAPPFSVRIAHASLDAKAAVSPLAVIVNSANPLDHMSMAEVTSIFSKPVRALVLSHWKQAGVQGDFGESAMEPAGLPWSDHFASEDRAFGDDVFFRKFGGTAPVDTYRMFKTYAEVGAFVAHEPAAVGIIALNRVPSGVKVVTIVDGPFARRHAGDAADIRGGHYPLDRFLYLNARVQSGKPLDSFVRAYLDMALSPAGQAAIAAEGEGYIPLNATEAEEEQGKLE